jgi:general secretion pathway protein F
MPRFLYKAKKGPTEIVQGEIDAETEDAALGKITSSGLVPIKLEPAIKIKVVDSSTGKTTAAPTETKAFTPTERAKARIRYDDLHIFTRQFAILLKASVPLLRIFEVLKNQTQNPKFRNILTDIQASLREGASLSETLQQYPKIYSHIYINMIHSGEVSGTLDKVLLQLASFAEKEAEIRSKVQSAIVYPLFLLLVGIGTIFVLLTFVMPRLMTLFSDLGTELPTVTQIIINISTFLQHYWIFILTGVTGITVFLRSKGLSPKQQKVLDGALLKMPVFGNLIQKAETAKFLRSVELLYENGIPLYQAVRIGTRTVSNIPMREELEKVPDRLEGGETLANSLERVPYISTFVTQMISVGEESGQLGSAVRETASFYEQQTNQVIKVATSLLEPLMILGIGLIVGFIVIAMLLPIFDIHVLAQ